MEMKRFSSRHCLFLFTSLIVLSGCSLSSSGSGTYSYASGTLLEKKDVSGIVYHDFYAQSQGSGSDSLLSKGNEKCLVIPIAFSDCPFSDQRLADLAVAFNGTSEETHYWESVSSFYQKSSFNQLTLSFTVAPVYTVGSTAVNFLAKSTDINSSKGAVSSTMALAINAYKSKTGNSCKDFDVDGNGFIDAVYLIYSCPDYASAKDQNLSDLAEREGYWAYTARDSSAHADTASPVGRSFTWASYDFMYRGVTERSSAESSITVDAHTYIHETGHLLGLDDYYSYTPSEDDYTNEAYKYYTPTGGLDMMDLNILDHDAWSKFALGWSKPYVVTSNETFPLTIELEESQLQGDCLLIPAYGEAYNGTAFDEYVMVELYTPDHLNALDATNKYASNYKYPQGFFIPGVKISHVDARICHYQSRSFDYNIDISKLSQLISASTSSSYYRVGASNTPNRSAKEGYRLIHLLEANGVNTFANTEFHSKYNDEYFYANNGTLFQGETGRSDFSLTRFASFFENKLTTPASSNASSSVASSPSSTTIGLFNSGKAFGYSLRINGLKSVVVNGETTYKVSLTITKA